MKLTCKDIEAGDILIDEDTGERYEVVMVKYPKIYIVDVMGNKTWSYPFLRWSKDSQKH